MTETAQNDDIKALSFEQAMEALERIVDDLERGDVPLDQSIRIYERGEALKAHCEKLLKSAEDKVEKIRLSRDGKPVAHLFINFMPEGGRPSWGQSNENGEFTLNYDPQRQGAEVGTHKVFVRFRPSSPQEELDVLSGKKKFHGDQKAIEAKYGKLETTPLTVEVKSGGGPIAIVVD